MIGVEGQYRASFSVAGFKDFLTEEQLHIFKIVEETGNILPTFELIFEIDEEKIIKYLNEGNVLTVTMGKTLNELEDSVLIPMKVQPTKVGENKFAVRIVGLYHALKYLTDRKVSISDKNISTTTIKNIVSPYFTFSTNASPNDSMHWIQTNITDRNFVTQVWMHSYIPDSFMAAAITMTGEFRLRDIKALAKDSFSWRFTNEEKDSKDILYEAPYEVKTASTFLNQVSAYGKKKVIANLEDGTFTLLEQNPASPTFSLSEKTITSKDISPRYDDHSYQSLDNVHKNFWKARIQNSVHLFGFSTVKLIVTFIEKFKKIHPLDLIFFKEEDTKSNRKFAVETYTGLYVVTKVSRMIERRQFKTQVEFVREAPNSSRID
ncbi:MAG: hypothetical protein WC511_02735 [Candidatus Pacearchaeota archaeon]